MSKYTHVYVLFLVFIFHSSCGRQNQTNPPKDNVSKGHYTEAQIKEAATTKVPMGMVRNVRQASNGDILVASYLGVFRYDGTSFTNISGAISSPRFASFWDVLEDRKGNLWFGTRDSGAYLLPAGQTTFQHFTTKDGLGSNSALHIYEDKAGNIWLGTGAGASRYDGKTFRNFTTKDGLPNNDINTFLEDKTGKLWIGTRGDACYYDGTTFTVLRNKEGKAFYNVWAIIEDKKGNIWFGGSIIKDKKGSTLFLDSGLWRYNGNTITKVSQRGAYAMIQDKKGNIWTTGEVKPQVWALSRYDAKSLYNEMPAVTEIKSGGRMVYLGLVEANDGSIWFGAMGPRSWVYRYDGKTFTDFKRDQAVILGD